MWRGADGKPVRYAPLGRCAVCGSGEVEPSAGPAGARPPPDPVLLCDGEGCSREFHLRCLNLPGVPEGEFFCPDCSIEGTSGALVDYFQAGEAERSLHGAGFVEELLKREVRGGAGRKAESKVESREEGKGRAVRPSAARRKAEQEAKKKGAKAAQPKEPPNPASLPSELDRVSEFALLASLAPSEPAPAPPPPTHPSALVGSAARLYLPAANAYHTGRILDYRRHAPPVISTQQPMVYLETLLGGEAGGEEKKGGGGERRGTETDGPPSAENTEFLLRFPSGSGGRKVPVHRWLILEEHRVAVSCCVCWGVPRLTPAPPDLPAPAAPPGARAGDVAWPAHVLARSRLEALAAAASHDPSALPVLSPRGSVRALSAFFGEDSSCLLPLHAHARAWGDEGMEPLRRSPDKHLCVAVAMAQVEEEERRR
ncbi:hypothetical protein TeGR_g15214, partial [Tetraparma gracilis]